MNKNASLSVYPSLPISSFVDQNTDTSILKKSGWYTKAVQHIEELEYEIKSASEENYFVSPNRFQNFFASYHPDKLVLSSFKKAGWELELTTIGVFSQQKMIYSPEKNSDHTIEKNKLQYHHGENFSVEYINDKKGLRQNFLIHKKPSSKSSLITIKLKTNSGWLINPVHKKEVHFAIQRGNDYEKKIVYNDLKVWDATNKELDAYFISHSNEIDINVNTENATYPITIDPLSTGISGTPDWIGDDADQADASYGFSVASAGDVNGDGYSDVIIGAYKANDGGNLQEGLAFVYHGSATGLSNTPNSILDDADQANAWFGYSVASAGDVNGDGYSDVIVGAIQYVSGALVDEGKVYVYHGSATGLLALPDISYDDANQAGAYFGYSVACAGDVNGDGFSDIVIGAPQQNVGGNLNAGMAYVYHGSATGLSPIPNNTPDDANSSGALLGISVASAGDVNGDGFSDVIIGASSYTDGPNTNEGRAYVYHGSPTGLSTLPDSTPDDADQAGASFGFPVASAGDVNGDGYSDVVIGANQYDDGANTDEGRAFVYFGSASGLSASPSQVLDDANQTGALYGRVVACAGDVNGDGYSDVIAGSAWYDDGIFTDEGRAFVYLGSATGLIITPFSTPDDANQSNAYFYTVASAGDVNGDGFSDVIIGALGFDDNFTDEGAAFVYHGSASGLFSNPASIPNDANSTDAGFGRSVASAGDVNADGFSDVIIGAPTYFDGGNFSEGRVFIYWGSQAGLSIAPDQILDDANQAGALFGTSVASAGDVNGDGYSDVICGAYRFDTPPFFQNGRAYLHYGSASGVSILPDRVLSPVFQNDAFFGFSTAGVGDINGDGFGDVAIGALGVSASSGAVYIYYGSFTGISGGPTIINGELSNDVFGESVAGAGDVNGDGFTDVIVGARGFDDGPNTNEGRAYIYFGAVTGISLTPNNILDDADQATASFGINVASAGDVNGDGYGDVIVGADTYSNETNNEGRIYVYHGSATGVSPTPDFFTDDGNQFNSYFGSSVASAGDINGDGYSDIIVGANGIDIGGETENGKAFVYQGSPAGINNIPVIIETTNSAGSFFGFSVASAGDVNGDGYSDIIIGAYNFDDPPFNNEGRAFIYYGNDKAGLRNNLRLYNADLITPIQQSNMNDPNLFGAGLYTKSFIGRQKGKLVWETVRNGNPFSGSPITSSTAFTAQAPGLTDLGLSGFELKHQIAKVIPAKATYIRARVKYDPTTAITGQVYGPWRYPEGFLRGRRDVGSVALPVRIISFSAQKQNEDVLLKWVTENEFPGLYYEVQHSANGTDFISLATIPSMNNSLNQYIWLHQKPAGNKNYYRIRAVEAGAEKFSSTRLIIFQTKIGIRIFPTILNNNEPLNILFDQPFTGKMLITLFDLNGREIKKWAFLNFSGAISVQFPDLPPGYYPLSIRLNDEMYFSKNILIKN